MKFPAYYKSAAFAAFCVLTLQTAQAVAILANVSDAQAINTTGGSTYTLSVTAASETTLKVGRYDSDPANTAGDAPNGSNSAAIFAFLLPNFGEVANPFTTATFTFELAATTNNWNVGLDGLGTRNTATVSGEDFRFGNTNGTTVATVLQGTVVPSAGAVGSYTSNDFTSYLNSQYNNGANAGNYVFLRLAISSNANGVLPKN
ncbi:MAG: hypothetical protein ABJQ29_15225 [Luteolibacter sp.]